MFAKIIRLALVVTICVFAALGLNLMIARTANAGANIFWVEIGYFVCAFLISRIVRMVSDKRLAMLRSIYLEYVFSLTYFVFSFFNLSVYAHLNFVIAFVMIFLWHSKILSGNNVLVFLILASFNAAVRWDRLFYLLLVTPTAYLLSLLLGIILNNGFSSALAFMCPDDEKVMNENERENHLKWWSFLMNIKLFVDANYDMNLDSVETRKIKKAERKSLSDTDFLQLQSPVILSESLSKIKRRDGMFSYDRFLKRANSVFDKIYNALYSNSIDQIEHLVSDALFEQFRYQMIEAGKKTGRLISVEFTINDLQIAQVNLDNNFDVLHLFARAVSRDYEAGPAEKNLTVDDVKADKKKVLNERVICEYWSFIRKPSAKTRDCPGLLEGQCPNCGTPIMIGQATVCPNCSSFIRSGQYDWVLTKITPASSWVYSEPSSIPGWQKMLQADSNFSVQQIEDRSSSIFWLLRASEKTRKIDGLRRFSEDEFCKNLAYEFENDSFGRYSAVEAAAFESASLKGISIGNDLDFCYILIIWNATFANKKGAATIKSMRDVLVLSRPHKSSTKINNSLSSIHCANCGGPLSSSFESTCTFCGSLVNDGSEWSLTRVIKESEPEYVNTVPSSASKAPDKKNSGEPVYTHGISGVDSATDVITIAAQILMADGKIDAKEMTMIKTIAARHSISEASLQSILDAVRSGMVHVPVPEPKSIGAQNLIREAAKMALADEELSTDEKDAIMNLGMQLGYSKIDIQQIINSELTALKNRLSKGPVKKG
ncbi:MAG: TIM44-like domain-containing protein [Candidatus Riflebacteria bacterium]|nr:TIM44-like domain-containing protein [Candidatus Riflebacteria bacterium]